MALVQSNATVGTSATKVLQMQSGIPYTAVQFTNGHTSAMYLGGASVTTSGATHGILLAAGANIQLWLNGGDAIYAVANVASGTGDLAMVYSGV